MSLWTSLKWVMNPFISDIAFALCEWYNRNTKNPSKRRRFRFRFRVRPMWTNPYTWKLHISFSCHAWIFTYFLLKFLLAEIQWQWRAGDWQHWTLQRYISAWTCPIDHTLICKNIKLLLVPAIFALLFGNLLIATCSTTQHLSVEALQNNGVSGFFPFCHHWYLGPRVMHCQLLATLYFSLWSLLVPIIKRGYLFGLSTRPMTLFS